MVRTYVGEIKFFIYVDIDMTMNKDVIRNLIGKAEETGFIPKSITCDQHGSNRKLYKKLGFRPSSPYMYSPTCPERKIYGIFDIVHVLKNLVNGLMDRAALLPDGYFISKEYWEPSEVSSRS